jgi:hypothetical protein
MEYLQQENNVIRSKVSKACFSGGSKGKSASKEISREARKAMWIA